LLFLAFVVSTCGAANVAGLESRPELTFTRVNGQRYSVWVANADGSGARLPSLRIQLQGP